MWSDYTAKKSYYVIVFLMGLIILHCITLWLIITFGTLVEVSMMRKCGFHGHSPRLAFSSAASEIATGYNEERDTGRHAQSFFTHRHYRVYQLNESSLSVNKSVSYLAGWSISVCMCMLRRRIIYLSLKIILSLCFYSAEQG